ncbi:MAG: chromate transporter [Bacillota bacterium]|nr:chromate transporter [Bacillota bacterium]
MRSSRQVGRLFLSFLRIGTFTLGGGWAMLPLIQSEVVDKQKWLEEREFVDLLALAQSVPGAVAVNTAVMVGYRVAGAWGLLAAVAGAVLPSLLVILLIAPYLVRWRAHPLVGQAFAGVRPAVVALIGAAALRLWPVAIPDRRALLIMALALLALGAGLHPVWVLAGGGLLGWWLYR